MPMIDLLPCPFCGLKPPHAQPSVRVICLCGAAGEWGHDSADAAAKWNTRALPPVQPELVTNPDFAEGSKGWTIAPEPAPALGASVSDWGTIPRSLYVVSAQTDGVVYTVTMCNVPYAMGPEVRYDLVAPITLHSDMRALVEAAQQTWEGLVGEYGYSKARVNFGGLEDALAKLKGGA